MWDDELRTVDKGGEGGRAEGVRHIALKEMQAIARMSMQ